MVKGKVVQRCCYCGTKDIDPTKLVPGNRPICDECKDRKEPLIVSASKSNRKRIVNQLKKKVQKKRKVNLNKQIASSDEEAECDSDEETLSDESSDMPISSMKKARLSESDAESDLDAHEHNSNGNDQRDDDDSVKVISCEERLDEPAVRKYVFSQTSKSHEHLGLSAIRTSPL